MQRAAAEAPPQPVESPALQFLPRLREAGAWELQGDPEVVAADQLESYLDWSAGIPSAYGALDATFARYSIPQQNRWASVRIVRYPDFVKAFGAYSSSVSESGRDVALGNRGAVTATSILFWSGPYVAQIMGDRPPLPSPPDATATAQDAPGEPEAPAASPEGVEVDAALAQLASSVAERMPKAEALPAVFRFMPQQRLIPGSEAFSAFPVLGQPILAGAFTARFQGENPRTPITGVIVPTPDKQRAAQVLGQYRLFFERNGRLLDPVSNLGEENFVAEDRLAGRSVAFRLDRFVIIFNGYDDILLLRDLAIESASRILNEIRAQLQALEEQESAADSPAATGGPPQSGATAPRPAQQQPVAPTP